MWTHSFWSVVLDLWQFVTRTELQLRTADTQALPALPMSQSYTKELITLDTHVPTPVTLEVGEQYTQESVETIAIRQTLKEYDAHLVQVGNLSLIEWLLYKIHCQNKSISLFALKMTPLGLWHQTCKGLPVVKVSIEPTTGALMEWFDAEQKSHVGLVARVAPDSVVTLHTISTAPSGTCEEQVFTESGWKLLGPVFTRF